ncbi:hypothetical protein [Eubacterium ruminantium]|uniref:hypothetical protein n=1 Tax=Eubacterium ruminantium TaxID=42322 RepID=UPI0015680754|nr:hypothetical protein [Eubacterium ruminantium]
MKTSVKLQEPISYMTLWLIIAAVLVALVIFMQVFFRIKLRGRLGKSKKIKIKKPKPKTLIEIKTAYLGKLAQIEYNLRSSSISTKEAYQKMSLCIRGFVYEATGIPVEKYTLTEIKEVGIPVLTQLVSEYYEPEFAMATYADVNQSILKTRKVLESWS